MLDIGTQLLRYLASPGSSSPWRSSYTGALQGTGDTKSPLYISLVSQIVVPLGILRRHGRAARPAPSDIWLAIVLGHVTALRARRPAIQAGAVAQIRVDSSIATPRSSRRCKHRCRAARP